MVKKICLAKRVWSASTPYIQIGGWVLVAVPATLSAFKLVSDAQAFNGRLTAIERAVIEQRHQNDVTNQRLDVVINLLRQK